MNGLGSISFNSTALATQQEERYIFGWDAQEEIIGEEKDVTSRSEKYQHTAKPDTGKNTTDQGNI